MIRINLAPPAEKRFQLSAPGPGVNLGLIFGGLLVLLAAGIGVYWAALDRDTSRLTAEITANEQELARLRHVIAEGERFRRDTEELERRVNALEGVARLQTRPVYLWDAVVSALTKDLWLTRMEEKDLSLRLAGTTYSSTALADFMANLKASGKFKDVDLAVHTQDLTKSPRTITFEVTCRFEI